MRAILYPHQAEQLQQEPARATPGATFGAQVPPGSAPAPEPADPDDYLARLAKHVPAEVLSIFLLVSALLDSEPLGWRITAVVFCAVAAVSLDRERRAKQEQAVGAPGLATGVIYDLFVLVAFAGWAVGVSAMARDLIDINQAQASFVTIAVAFGLARADVPLARRFGSTGKTRRGRTRRKAGERRIPRRHRREGDGR